LGVILLPETHQRPESEFLFDDIDGDLEVVVFKQVDRVPGRNVAG